MKKLLRRLDFPSRLPLSLLVVALTPAVSAQVQPTAVPSITVSALGLGVELTNQPDATVFKLAADGTSWELVAPYDVPGAPWLTVEELRFETDPIVYGNILVQNVSGVSQIYTLGYTLPTTWPAPNLIRGSIDTSIIGTAGQISALPNSSIYSAQIDLNTVRTLQDYPFTLSTPQNAVSQSAQFGFDVNGVAVGSSIGIQLRFQLSPGDTAAIISDFEVTTIPEPSSLALALLGACVVVWQCRRRK